MPKTGESGNSRHVRTIRKAMGEGLLVRNGMDLEYTRKAETEAGKGRVGVLIGDNKLEVRGREHWGDVNSQGQRVVRQQQPGNAGAAEFNRYKSEMRELGLRARTYDEWLKLRK